MGEDPEAIRAEIEQTRAEMGDTVEALGYKADVKSRAKDKVSDTRDKVTGKISEAKDRVVGTATDARDRVGGTVSDATGTVSDRTPDAAEVKAKGRRAASVAQQNPLGLAIGSAAVGFLAGMLVPSTRVEDEKLGPVADQVKEQVKATGQEALERGKEVAQQAASTAKDTAQEAGREHAEELRSSTQDRASNVSPG
jgi:gas vesicle protein